MVGRLIGYRKEHWEYRKQYSKEIELIGKGLSIRDISALTHRSPNTILKLTHIARGIPLAMWVKLLHFLNCSIISHV